MTESEHSQAIRKKLELQGDDKESVEATMRIINLNEKSDAKDRKNDSVRSWISLFISALAVFISFIALLK